MYHHITLKDLRPKLPDVIKEIDNNLERFIISKRGNPVAIILSIDDFESMLETLNETTDEQNMQKIKKGIQEAKQGKTVSWDKVKKKYHI